jgi:hypothetical protein
MIMKLSGNYNQEGENAITNAKPLLIIMGAFSWMASGIFLDLVDNIVATMLTCHSLDLDKNSDVGV